MCDAFRAVRKNRGAAGVDRVSIEMFEANLDQNLARLMRQHPVRRHPDRSAQRGLGWKHPRLETAQAKFRFVRYADDFVILCWSKHRAEEARKLVESCLTELGLKLSHEKTKVTTFSEGFLVLGFDFHHQASVAEAGDCV